MEQGNFTYILECSDGSFYTGWTNNLERRVKAHNAGKGAKYTKSRKPVKLVYFETFLTKQEAFAGRKMEADSSEEAIKIQKQTAQTGTTVCVSEQSVFLCQSRSNIFKRK